MRINNWYKLTIVIPGICAGFLLFLFFSLPAHAEESCLRGGDGTCVELLRETPNSSGAYVPSKSITGPSTASNFMTLADGSMVAMVAKAKTSFGNNSVTNLNRYEIELYYTRDGGMTWTKPPITNKGSWYVDEHRDGSISQGVAQDAGVGFLGFDVSSVYDAAAKKTYIVLAHTIACAVSNNNGNPDGNSVVPSITTFDEYNPLCDNPGKYVSGSVYIDTIVYDHADHSFDEFGKTRAFTHSDGIINGGWECSIGICYGAAYGADHPSVAATIVDSTLRIWTSYSAFRGGNCQGGTDSYYWNQCADQNMRDWNMPPSNYNDHNCNSSSDKHKYGCYEPVEPDDPLDDSTGVRNIKKFWVRQLQIDTATGQLSAVTTANPRADNYDMGERIPATGSSSLDGGNLPEYFVSKIVMLRGKYPLVLYSYSAPASTKNPLQWTYWNGSSWTAPQSVEGADPSSIIKNSYTGIQHIVGSVLSSNGWEKNPALAAVSSPQYPTQLPYNYSTNNTSNMVAHVVAYGRTTNTTTKYVPVYLRFYMNEPGVILDNPEALVLADDTYDATRDSLGVEAITGLPMYVNPDLGGPSIGWGRSYAYVAVPESLNDDANTSSVVYARIRPQTNSYWTDTLSSLWFADKDINTNPDTPIYFQATNPSPGVSEGFAQPKITNYPSQFIPLGGSARPEALSNIFLVQMIFARAKDNAASGSSSNWFSVGYSGNNNTNGIRGWAWAESVGWVSLSCANLSTCYSKNYDSTGNAWSTREGGLYYGVRAVTNSTFPSRTLIGKAWSERVGFISFDRETGVYKDNPCGNPPVATTSPYYINNSGASKQCALLADDISDDPSADIKLKNWGDTPATDFQSAGSLRIDSEVINYNGIDSNGKLLNVKRETTSPALTNKTYISKARSHEVNTPVFWINGNDVTTDANGAYDIIRGINSFDSSSYQFDGYARAESWATYQRDYCKNPVSGDIKIGSSYPAPCDKEWGWVKMSGEWSTVHWGTFQRTSSCGNSSLYSTSVDGYPDPALTGENEKLFVSGPDTYLWEYSGINDNSRSFALTENLPALASCPVEGTSVAWTATLANSILTDSTSIRLSSVAGLLSSGKLIIHQDTNVDLKIDAEDSSEVIEYTSVNESTKTIEFVTRGADGSTAQNWDTSAFIEQVNETGNYNTFVIPVGYMQPEQTLGGFGWSAPNTETLNPDPNISRYKDNLAGFGWINFQPNKLEQIYPYLRTLFGNLYVGGDINIVGPEYNNITPKQYSSTYQIATNGSISPYIGEQQGASSGQLQQCLSACGDQMCVNECTNAYGPSDAPDFNFEQGSSSVLGKVPDLDAMSTLVSECQGWDPAANEGVGGYVDQPCSNANGQQARELGTIEEFGSLATTGLNKYGQQVILCRADPSNTDPWSDAVFFGGGYEKNPPECEWTKSEGFTATLAEPYPAGQDYVCITGVSGAITSDTGKMTFANDEGSMNTVSYTKTSDNTDCAVSTKLNITFSSTFGASVGATVTETDFPSFYKVKRSHTGRPTVYILPDTYTFFAFHNTPMQFNNASEGHSGAITFVFPGSIFFLDSQMRYCPQGLHLMPCKASDDIQYNPTTNDNPNTKVIDTSQIASVAWLADGSITNADGFWGISFYPEAKMYRVGAFVAMGETNETWNVQKPGTYWSIYLINTGLQLNVYGLVIARNFNLSGHYYRQDENEFVVEPSENFIYDGRVVVNPPPGLEDLASGLPTIRQAIP
ncbi:MAG: hypothetical protein COT25_02285 [Candidatus Kerfeldbacteria bacterium CG08_land_8_20_14_0_20_42_7]|uniref:Uncharacterized protein n=1 Tax=Candidatus Kerfeldbacteria bacterium CG08_land_8_20_14_0_20_42_7 TaxID=2014245 RepID=A0A2H0YTI3_9BACT|nr:MAG: hypothetical protein COT25_02285 [Candidatus Kerfeldbacteria bacterium CG08_land_8_20_14_0_20_42_7]